MKTVLFSFLEKITGNQAIIYNYLRHGIIRYCFDPARKRNILKSLLQAFFLSFLLGNFSVLMAQKWNESLPDKIHVKFSSDVVPAIEQLPQVISGADLSLFQEGSLKSFHSLNTIYSASRIKRLFPYSGKFETRHRDYGLDRWYEISFAVDSNTFVHINTLVELYNSDINIEIAEPVYKKMLIEPIPETPDIDISKGLMVETVNDPYFSNQWNLENRGQTGGTIGADINITKAWEIQSGDPEVIVAIIDGGIDVTHEDLEGSIWINQEEYNGMKGIDDDDNGYIDDINGYNFVNNTGKITPHFHGIHVSGIIAGVTNNNIGIAGIAGGNVGAEGVKMMSCAVFENYYSGGFANAFVYAADNGAVIAQNSWGYNYPDSYEQSLLDAIDYFIDNAGYDINGQPTGPIQGGVVIFAAGNNNDSGAQYPAYYEHVVAVASTDHLDQRSYFSNYGDWIDISAPGSKILSTYLFDTYKYLSGTSMACPHVSGVAALIASEYKTKQLHCNAIKDKLFSSCSAIDHLNPDYQGLLGHGRLNAYNALQQIDTICPSAVVDLSVSNISPASIELTWTATGADAMMGIASYYEIRYSTSEFDSSNFESASIYRQNINPKEAGETELFTLTGLKMNTSYYFALQVYDLHGNGSDISNIVKTSTSQAPIMVIKPNSLNTSMKSNQLDEKQFVIYNKGTGELVFSISIDGVVLNQFTLADNTGRLFALGSPGNQIYELNPVNGDIINNFSAPEPTDGGKVGLAFDGTHLLFINGYESNQIYKIDPVTGAIADILSIPDLPGIYGLGASNNRIYASYVASNNNVLEIDPVKKEILRTIDLGYNSGLGLAYAGKRSSLFMTNGYANVKEISVSTGEVLNEFTPTGPVYGAGFSNSMNILFLGIQADIQNEPRIEACNPDNGNVIYTINSTNCNALAADEVLPAGWLTTDIYTGKVQSGDSLVISAIFNSNGLAPDNYFKNIQIITNDPENETISLPVHLHVKGTPEIVVKDEFIDFKNSFIGYKDSLVLTIINAGTDSLTLTDSYTDNSLFTIDSTLINESIYKNDSCKLIIYFTPVDKNPVSATLFIASNDPSEPLVEIQLSGTGTYPPNLSVSADTIYKTVDYNSYSSEELIVDNNEGYSNLNLNISIEAPVEYSFHNFGALQKSKNKDPNQEAQLDQNNLPFYLADLTGISIGSTQHIASMSNLIMDLENRGAKVTQIDIPLKQDLILNNFDILIIGSLINLATTEDIARIHKWNLRGGGLFITNTLTLANSNINALLANSGIEASFHYGKHEQLVNFLPHIISKNVDTLTYMNYYASYQVDGDAKILAANSEGLGRIALSENGEGRIVTVGSLIAVNSHTEHIDTRLFINRIIDWLSLRSTDWLDLNWYTAELPAATKLENTIHITPGYRKEEVYEAQIMINSNDPSQQLKILPCFMDVKGIAGIELNVDTVRFDSTFIGTSAINKVIITNSGTGVLTIDSIYTIHDNFSVQTNSLIIPPKKSQIIEIKFTPLEEIDYNDTIKIISNACEISPVYIFLSGTGLYPPKLKIEPLAITDTLIIGDSVNYQIKIGNHGLSTLAYQLSPKKYFGKPQKNVTAENEIINNFNDSILRLRNSWTEISDIGEVILSAEKQEIEVACIPGTKQKDVLLIYDDISDMTEIEDYLSEYAEFNIVKFNADSTIPDLQFLIPFETVIIGNDGYWNNGIELGNILADYADIDGGLIFTVPAFHASSIGISGRILKESYMPFNNGYRTGSGELGYLDENHPISENVKSASLNFIIPDITFSENADVIATLSYGEPFIGAKRNVVGINAFICGTNHWTGDIPLIQRNSIYWLSDIPFLTIDNDAGKLAAESTSSITISINSTHSIPGDSLKASLIIQTNDPSNQIVRIPISIYVTPPPPPDVDNVEICEEDHVPDLYAYGADIRWYSDPELSILVCSGNTFNTGHSLPGTYTYYVTQTIHGFESQANIAYLTIKPRPSAPAGVNEKVCEGDQIPDLFASGENVRWYTDEELTNLVNEGNIYSTNEIIPDAYTYYVTQTINNCTSAWDSITLTINAKPDPPTGIDTSVCENNEVPALTASGDSLKWYSDINLTELLFQGNNFESGQTIPGKYVYYITQTISSCESHADSIVLNIISLPYIDLGHDTSIMVSDNLILRVNDPSYSCLWNDGSILSSLEISGEDYGIGEFDFWVIVTDSNNCTNIDSILITITPLVSNFVANFDNEFRIFPDPANSYIIIELTGVASENIDIEIINQMGIQMLEKRYYLLQPGVNQYTIDISNLAKGIYVIIVSGDRRHSSVYLFIKD